ITTYSYQFNNNLTVDSSPSEEIRMLQRYLNSRGFAVNSPGLGGSSGYETNEFGSATKSALERYQASKGIGPVSQRGNFGPQTRRVVNPDILANGLTYTVITSSGTTTTGGETTTGGTTTTEPTSPTTEPTDSTEPTTTTPTTEPTGTAPTVNLSAKSKTLYPG